MNHTLFHRIVLFALTAVGLFALVYLGLFAWVCYAESHLETSPETDVIIVLGAQVKPDGTPSVQLEYRLETALSAYRDHPQKVVCCGGQAGTEPAPEGRVMADWLIARGVPAADVLAETVSENTKDNIRNALALLGYSAGQPAEAKPRVLVVTSDYHVARALQIARDQGLRAWGRSAPTLPEYWLKNRAREALGWGKYLVNKVLGR